MATTWLSRVLNEMIQYVKILTNTNNLVVPLTCQKKKASNFTRGVSRVDDAQGSGIAVASSLVQGALQLADVQTPALFLIKVIVDLHSAQFGERSWVQGILRYGDHDACTGRTFPTHQQLQHGLKVQDREAKKVGSIVLPLTSYHILELYAQSSFVCMTLYRHTNLIKRPDKDTGALLLWISVWCCVSVFWHEAVITAYSEFSF